MSEVIKYIENMGAFITVGLFLSVFGVICYWAIKVLCDNKATNYFNANIKDSLTSMFNGYKQETIDNFESIKGFREFKDSKILILNDTNKFIHNQVFFAKFNNKKCVLDINETIDINDYSIVIINADTDTNVVLNNWKHTIDRIDNKIPILIYTGLNRIDNSTETELFSNKIYTPVNNSFTLIDRLHTSYMIKKIMEDSND